MGPHSICSIWSVELFFPRGAESIVRFAKNQHRKATDDPQVIPSPKHPRGHLLRFGMTGPQNIHIPGPFQGCQMDGKRVPLINPLGF